jgi:hypothetical protein
MSHFEFVPNFRANASLCSMALVIVKIRLCAIKYACFNQNMQQSLRFLECDSPFLLLKPGGAGS